MAFQKRIIILSDINTKRGVGIVKLMSTTNCTRCEISINEPKNINVEAIYKCNDFSSNKSFQNETTFDINVNNFSSFDIMIFLDNKPYILGTTCTNKSDISAIQNTLISIKNQQEKAYIQSVENKSKLDELNTKTSEENAEKIVEKNTENASLNMHENAIKNNIKSDGNTDENTDENIDNISFSGKDFYIAVKPQIDEMFICFPRDSILENTVPNSKWVRVENDDETYVVGIIYELDAPKYLVYGIPKTSHTPPPKEIENICDWLPLSLDNIDGAGFYLIYQDAKTGKTLKNPQK